MLTDSLVTSSKLECADGPPSDGKPSCLFWTRQDMQLCAQSFSPRGDVFYRPHTHSEYTIVVCLQGEILKTQLGETHVIGRGGAMIGNHGVERASGYLSQNGRSCEAVSVSVDRRVLDSLAQEFKLPAADGETSPAFLGKVESAILLGCAQGIAEELHGGLPGHKIIIETLVTRLLVETLRAWPRASIASVAADLSPRLPRRDFVRAHEFMRWCRKENFRLQNLCQFLGSSEERFARLFLASTRQTPASFYNRMLLERAQGLLRDAKLSVKAISFELGFKTCSHFIAAFRREFAVTPQEYRQGAGSVQAGLRFG